MGSLSTSRWLNRPSFAGLHPRFSSGGPRFPGPSSSRPGAAVGIASPANKDRPETRRAFVAKCAALLQERVCVAIVDLVTTRRFDLYGDLLELIGQTDPALAPESPSTYAAACRRTHPGESWRFQTWNHALALGQPLPMLPLWLADDLAVPLELEESYEETCRILRLT